MTDSQWVASRLGHPVLKVVNNIAAPSLKDKASHGEQRLGITVAGSAGEDKQVVSPSSTRSVSTPWTVETWSSRGDYSRASSPTARTWAQISSGKDWPKSGARTSGSFHALRDQVDFGTAVQRMSDRM
jgi:hypothetical protein